MDAARRLRPLLASSGRPATFDEELGRRHDCGRLVRCGGPSGHSENLQGSRKAESRDVQCPRDGPMVSRWMVWRQRPVARRYDVWSKYIRLLSRKHRTAFLQLLPERRRRPEFTGSLCFRNRVESVEEI